MGKKERKRFSDQCFDVLKVLRDFDPEAASSESDNPVLSPEYQAQAWGGITEGVIKGLEEQAKKIGRKGAFKGLVTIWENGKT